MNIPDQIQNIRKCFSNPENIEREEFPIDRRMEWITKAGIDGLSSENVRFYINEVVNIVSKNLPVGEIGTYLEVGSYQGCSLLSAAYKNKDNMRFFAIDNFSEFGNNEDILINNICTHIPDNDVLFFNDDYRNVIKNIDRIDVYLYDASHDYVNQLEGLNVVMPILRDRCVIIVDDAAWPNPHKANMEWFEKNKDLGFKTDFISYYTPEEWVNADEITKQKIVNNKYWWNGIRVFYRGF